MMIVARFGLGAIVQREREVFTNLYYAKILPNTPVKNVGWVRRAFCAVTHLACLKKQIELLSQRLVGYAKNAHPPYMSA